MRPELYLRGVTQNYFRTRFQVVVNEGINRSIGNAITEYLVNSGNQTTVGQIPRISQFSSRGSGD